MSSWGDAKDKYEKQMIDGKLLNHSELSESYRNHRTLWLRIKNRYSGDIVYPKLVEAIFDWSEYIGAKTEQSCSRNPDKWRRHGSIMFCNEYFTAIFPQNDWQESAIKLVWGEHFTPRILNVPTC